MASTFRGLLGEKLGMTQVFDENNRIVPVTVVKAGPCVVTQVRTPERDGYNAIQIGFGEIDGRKVNKPRAGHFATAGTTPRPSTAMGESSVAWKASPTAFFSESMPLSMRT